MSSDPWTFEYSHVYLYNSNFYTSRFCHRSGFRSGAVLYLTFSSAASAEGAGQVSTPHIRRLTLTLTRALRVGPRNRTGHLSCALGRVRADLSDVPDGEAMLPLCRVGMRTYDCRMEVFLVFSMLLCPVLLVGSMSSPSVAGYATSSRIFYRSRDILDLIGLRPPSSVYRMAVFRYLTPSPWPARQGLVPSKNLGSYLSKPSPPLSIRSTVCRVPCGCVTLSIRSQSTPSGPMQP